MFNKIKNIMYIPFAYINLALLKLNLVEYTIVDMVAAARMGDFYLVRFLLNETNISPCLEENSAIKLSSSFGRLNIVQLLLNDKRVNPSIDQNHAIRIAFINNHFEISEKIWKDQRVKNSLKKDDKDIYNHFIKLDIKDKINEF